jgi:hypothetical protein
MNKQSEYVTRMETQLKQWDADVDALAAKGREASADSHSAYEKQIEHLRSGREAMKKSFHEMQVATAEAGAKMQAGVEVAWDTMQKSLAKVTADLRK